MAEINNSKKIFLPAIVLATSIQYSILFTGGIVLGYLASKLFCKILGIDEHNGDKVFLDIGKWKIHLHHWIMGIIILSIVWVIDYFYLPTFFAGVVCGIIIQDIYDYNDWYKVVLKKSDLPR